MLQNTSELLTGQGREAVRLFLLPQEWKHLKVVDHGFINEKAGLGSVYMTDGEVLNIIQKLLENNGRTTAK